MARGKTRFDVELAEEPVVVLGIPLEAVARKEAVGGEGEADVGRFGDVEGRQGQLQTNRHTQADVSSPRLHQKGKVQTVVAHLVFSGLEADIVAELEEAGERIVEDGDTLLAQREVENHHWALYVGIARGSDCCGSRGGVDLWLMGTKNGRGI